MKYLKYLFLSAAFCCLTCNKDDDGNTSEGFQVQHLITDLTNTRILPELNVFHTEVLALKQSIESYNSDKSESQLDAIRTQWKTTASAYGNIYGYNIGIAKAQNLDKALFSWPTTPSAIENFLNANSTISESDFSALSPQIKTLSALDYLLFEDDLTLTNTKFTTEDNRMQYLQFTVNELAFQSNRLLEIWQPSGSDYAHNFINNSSSGIEGSFNLFFNGFYNLIDNGKITKIGKPAGLENSQNTNPDLVQARYSGYSLSILRENINSLESVYFNDSGLGISDYVFAITNNQELNELVQGKINEVKTAIDLIPTSLAEAINTNPQLVSTLHSKLNDLRIIFAVDLRSTLSIIITVTDNDGD